MSENDTPDRKTTGTDEEQTVSRRLFLGGLATAAGVGTTSSPSPHTDEPFWPNVDDDLGRERTGLEAEPFAYVEKNGFRFEQSSVSSDTAEPIVESHHDFEKIAVSFAVRENFEEWGAWLSPEDAEQLGASLFAHAKAVRSSDE